MPVSKNGVGHSQVTLLKQDGLAKLLSQHLSACRAILANHPYWPQTYRYIDANSGSGFNECEGCDGSPVIFLKTVNRLRIPYFAYFIDIEPFNTFNLEMNVAKWNGYEILTGDNRDILPWISSGIPSGSLGLLYSDPNGIPDFEMIAEVSHNPKLRRMDILIRYAASAVKRNQHISGQKMLDYLHMIHKDSWIVREIEHGDRWQWTFLLGMNWDGLNAWKSQGFHYAKSKEGQAIIEKLNYTNDEIKEMLQPELPLYATYEQYLAHPIYRAIRQQAIDRNNGICERCNLRPVTEVHHIEYPEWGTFEENADNLLALCHQCHCEIHGKEH